MLWKSFAYALLCVTVPVVWGLVVYRVSNLLEHRLRRKLHSASGTTAVQEEAQDTVLPLEYHI